MAEPALVDEIVLALEAGDVVALPTDTVYGIAARAADADATGKLFDLKGRERDQPLAVLCGSTEQALALADDVTPALAAVTARWWPGPLTLVVGRRPGLGLRLGGVDTTVGLRVPDHDLVRTVAARSGPLAVTSANRHGEPTPSTVAEVAATLGAGVALVVDGGPLHGSASTVIDTTASPWRVLRQGTVDPADVHAVAKAAAADDG